MKYYYCRRGSIIARVTSSFHIVDTRQTSINDIENNIFSTFVQRVDNGSFGLPVDKTAFTISGEFWLNCVWMKSNYKSISIISTLIKKLTCFWLVVEYGLSTTSVIAFVGRSRSRTGKDPCDPSLTTCDQICTSDGTNVQCSCFKGYQLNGYKCEGTVISSPFSFCISLGTYHKTCTLIKHSTYFHSGVDICGLGLDKCDHKTTYCLNGGYQTFTCPCLVGYKPDPSLVTTSSPLGQLPPTPTSCIGM